MAYEITFLPKQPAFVFAIDEYIWNGFHMHVNPSPKNAAYLGKKTVWESDATTFGFGGCGSIEVRPRAAYITFLLSQESLKRVMLTISFLLEELNMFQNRMEDFLTVESGCGQHHPLYGYVSAEFRRKLPCITAQEQGAIVKNMRKAFTAVTPHNLRQYESDCRLLIDAPETSFIFSCFGDACVMGMYPDEHSPSDSPASFTCHNLDSAYQQATLLAGLATLAEKIRNAK